MVGIKNVIDIEIHRTHSQHLLEVGRRANQLGRLLASDEQHFALELELAEERRSVFGLASYLVLKRQDLDLASLVSEREGLADGDTFAGLR